MTYKNIIFDIGRVLFDYRWKEMFMDCGLEEEEALRVGNLIFADPEELWQPKCGGYHRRVCKTFSGGRGVSSMVYCPWRVYAGSKAAGVEDGTSSEGKGV